MAIPWDSIRSLLLFFGPVLLPKAISWYRSVRDASRAADLPLRPVPPNARLAVALLLGLAAAFLVKALPVFAPENLFAATQSRLQIPVDVLFARVGAALRSRDPSAPASLTPTDEALRARFVNLESRLLYLQFGPEVLADCPFCAADEPRTGATLAVVAASVVAALDVYLVSSYNYQANARALRLSEVDFFFWRTRAARLVTLAGLDAMLAGLLYLSATNRAFAQLPSPAERVDNAARAVAAAKSRMSAVGIIKNTALRDEDLRARSHAYWTHEVRLMRDVMEEREVIEGVNDALTNRIDIQAISRDADMYAHSVLEQLRQDSADGTI
ncbi:hypothetical protein ACCO45_003801 [Purpureocillium lilacinum]|uniref:Uncharacterized protein n=1 Tax=Purpureocillium lilacinum TaxID=33203 RepID=A0ACC4E1R8_PURLI